MDIELKSGAVSEEAIRKQLMQNRYYLSVLGRSIQSYTYISSQNRLVRLTNHDLVVFDLEKIKFFPEFWNFRV